MGVTCSIRFQGRKPGRIYGSLRSRPRVRARTASRFRYLQAEFDEKHGRFSPNGRWVAYTSNESGRDEVYVQSFPLSGAKFQISANGGREPQWRKDGTELFYIAEYFSAHGGSGQDCGIGRRALSSGLAQATVPGAVRRHLYCWAQLRSEPTMASAS